MSAGACVVGHSLRPIGLGGWSMGESGAAERTRTAAIFCPQPHRGGQHPAYHNSLSDRHPKFLYIYIIIAALC